MAYAKSLLLLTHTCSTIIFNNQALTIIDLCKVSDRKLNGINITSSAILALHHYMQKLKFINHVLKPDYWHFKAYLLR